MFYAVPVSFLAGNYKEHWHWLWWQWI